jgi:hypothetical protein
MKKSKLFHNKTKLTRKNRFFFVVEINGLIDLNQRYLLFRQQQTPNWDTTPINCKFFCFLYKNITSTISGNFDCQCCAPPWQKSVARRGNGPRIECGVTASGCHRGHWLCHPCRRFCHPGLRAGIHDCICALRRLNRGPRIECGVTRSCRPTAALVLPLQFLSSDCGSCLPGLDPGSMTSDS